MIANNIKYIAGIAGFCLYSIALLIGGYGIATRGKSEAIVEQLADDKEAVIEARVEYKEVEVKVIEYVDRIETVVDTSGCLDTAVPDGFSDGMLDAYNAATRSKTD